MLSESDKQLLNSRKARLAVFIFAGLCLYVIENAAWTVTRSVLSPDSFIPFSILVSIPLLLSLRLKSSVIPLIGRCCVPIGIMVAALNAANAFYSITGQMEDDLLSFRLAFSPLALGVLLSYLMPLLESPDKQNYLPKKTEVYFLGCTAFAAVCGIWTVYFENSLELFMEPGAVLVVLTVLAIGMSYPGSEALNDSQNLLNIGLFVCVVAAVIGLASYSAAVPQGPDAIFPAVATGIFGMFFGAFLTFVATLFGGQSAMEVKEARYFDWHLIESWAFLALMLLGPPPLLEVVCKLPC